MYIYRLNPPDRPIKGKGTFGVSTDIEITNEMQFNDLVLGAMAELSDDGVAPAHITYKNVMELSKQLQETSVGSGSETEE